MPTTPEISKRTRQPYVAIRTAIPRQELTGLADRLGDVSAWLARRGIARAGPPFFRYNVIDMGRLLDVEAGVPVPVAVRGDSRVTAGVLPAGRYVTALHVGPYDGLTGVVDSLLRWADDRDLEWDKSNGDDGEHWGCRLEIYRTDPRQQPDPARWVTQLAFRLRSSSGPVAARWPSTGLPAHGRGGREPASARLIRSQAPGGGAL